MLDSLYLASYSKIRQKIARPDRFEEAQRIFERTWLDLVLVYEEKGARKKPKTKYAYLYEIDNGSSRECTDGVAN